MDWVARTPDLQAAKMIDAESRTRPPFEAAVSAKLRARKAVTTKKTASASASTAFVAAAISTCTKKGVGPAGGPRGG